mgnify:CR=1 FL=1
MKGGENFMKNFILLLFIIISISSYSETSIEWKVEKGINPWEITVRCTLYGDLFKNYNLTIKPFGKGLGEDRVFTDGRYYDSSTKMSLIVTKKNNFQYNSEIADYECYLEKDNKNISTFKFRIKGVLIIEQ